MNKEIVGRIETELMEQAGGRTDDDGEVGKKCGRSVDTLVNVGEVALGTLC